MWRLSLLPVLLLLSNFLPSSVDGIPQVKCFFIFGDSLSDSGNNNGLQTLARANFLPYGIDFPGGPTGRFTNGRTIVDLIGDHLGLGNYIPPFANATGREILNGVNYASGSAGILPATGQLAGGGISFEVQLQNHQLTISSISRLLGGEAPGYLSECLYSVYIGSNDYMLNYFSPGSSATRNYSPKQFTNDLIDQISQRLKNLYELGARRVVVFGLAPMGCLPLFQVTGSCDNNINNAIEDFNYKLKDLVDKFNKEYPDAQFIFVDTFSITSPNLSSLGLPVLNLPCCGVGNIYCLPMSSACQNRNGYAYWDDAHPTEAANRVVANRAYKAQHPNDTYPTDISHLVQSPEPSITSNGGGVKALSYGTSVMISLVLMCVIVFIM
ncbi:hypothetical protein Nepgr_021279 [Nepenthes gracilis]|uniref:Uncharacterized protein n=1 Tax=Nepenthes gracilis TaxID=150966 RepID=A0AAD3XVZ3_NEPGR|nr:hypothetical protein Nepgr_021279 [Nepenthes gracilis]